LVKKIWRNRGRPHNSVYSYKNLKILEYLAKIAVKNKIDSSKLLNCIMDAWKKGEANCKELNILCRKKKKDSAIFLFTKDGKVVAQFTILAAVLQEDRQIERYIKAISAKKAASNNFEVLNPKIRDLKTGMKKVNLKAKVIEVPKAKMVHTRYGTTAYVSHALIEDETGSVRLSLWNQQINRVNKGDVIGIKNGKVISFSGQRQLSLGRSGSLSIIE
jgi:replication factor A1